jgi:hypothetical protein
MILSIGNRSPIISVSLLWNKSAKSIPNGGTLLNQDFREFIQSLNDNDVRYLVVGGYAVALLHRKNQNADYLGFKDS